MRGKRTTTAVSITLAILLMLAVFSTFSNTHESSSVPQPEPKLIPEIIDGIVWQVVDQGTEDVDHNITVINGGKLVVVNSTLNFLSDINYQNYHLTVIGGSLTLKNSTITTGTTVQAQWYPFFEINLIDSNLTLSDHSALAFPGWLNVSNTCTYINDSWITSLWPDARTTDPTWSNDFPTFIDVVIDWWSGSGVDLNDSTDDGPIMMFKDSKNITIAESRIDEILENDNLLMNETNNNSYPTMITLNNTEMSIINSFIAVDWLNGSANFSRHNAIDVRNNSNLYLYNVSMETDDNNNQIDDYLEVPIVEDPEIFMPYRVQLGCEVFHYKWIKVPVIDELGRPIVGANLNATYLFPNPYYVSLTSYMNNFSAAETNEKAWANNRILSYMNRTSERNIDAINYTFTDMNGEVLLPLLCEFINSTNYPNGDHVGEYVIDVSYWNGTVWFNESTYADFIPWPSVRPEENLIITDPVILKLSRETSLALVKGWNLLSVPLEQVETSIDEVLKDIDGKWNYIQYYNSTDLDHWKSNATFKPDQLNDLKALNHKMAFWINITEPNVNLTVYGYEPGTTTIPLYTGWNLVGYPTLNDTMTVANALWGTGADRVEKFDAMAPYRISEVGPSYVMKPGEGYWIHVPADTLWTIDW